MPYKEFCVFFSGKLFYKSNRKLFSCVCIAWYKHSRRWENSRQLCKPLTSSRVCITVSNSPNPSRVYIRLCKHGKRFLLLKYCIGSLFIKRPSKIWHILFNKDEYIYSKGNFLLHNTANSVPNINDGNKFATCKIKKKKNIHKTT